MTSAHRGSGPRRALTGLAALSLMGATLAPLTAAAVEGPIAPGPTPAPESKIQDNVLSGVEQTPNAYFIQFAGASVTEGGSIGAIQAEREAFLADAAEADVQVEVRQEFGSLWNGVSVTAQADDLEALAASQVVEAIFPVGIIEAPELPEGTVDPEMFTARGMTGADIVVSELGFTGEGIKVGILDTGIDIDHPDLGGNGTPGSTPFPSARVTHGYDFVGDTYNADPSTGAYQPKPFPDNNPDDCQGHGTHVAGIVGASGEVDGVAPNVTFGAYRVFGCSGSTDADIMLHAMEKSLEDGMDVLNLSVGSAFSSWAEYPTSRATDALAAEGVVVVASIGNEGDLGLHAAGSPGVGTETIGVGSVDNVAYMSAAFTDELGNEIPYVEADAGPVPMDQTVPLVAVREAGSPESFGCSTDPYTDAEKAEIAGKWLLVSRGSCSFYEKSYNAQQAGAAGVVIYNNAPGVINPTVAGDPPVTVPVIMVSQTDGIALANRSLAGEEVTATFTGETTSAPNPTGGRMSDFSSYGPTADMRFKPDVSAPGGSIYATYPLEKAPYASLSGTSMASPHVAGAVALMLEAEPGQAPMEIKERLQNTSVQLESYIAPGSGFIDTVQKQGAGMIQVDDAILADITLEPGLIQLGQQAAGVTSTHTITLTNRTDSEQTYAVSTESALATSGTAHDYGYYIAAADVTLGAESVTVPAGGTATVDVTISQVDPDLIYGGYVHFTSGEDVYTVAYGGYSGDLQDVEVLTDYYTTNEAGETVVDFELPVLAKLTGCEYFVGVECTDENGSWNVFPEGGVDYTMTDGDVPSVAMSFQHQARKMVWTAFEANADGTKGASLGVVKEEDYLSRTAAINSIRVYVWDGKVVADNGARVQVPSGDYILQVEVTKAQAWNDTRTAAVESWESPAFGIAWEDTAEESMVTRYLGQDRYAVASEIAVEHFPQGTDKVYIASGHVFPDALAGAPLAGTEEHPILLTRSGKLPAPTRMALQQLAPSEIVILGGPATISGAVEADLANYGAVSRIGGADRYAVAANVAANYPTNTGTVFIASGQVFPDALTAAARAGMEGAPVMLTREGALPGVTKAQLDRFTPERIVIVGGPATISTDVEAELAAYADEVVRIGGKDRYAVAANVAKLYDTPTAQAWIAKGTDYPDALSAGPIAAINDSPVLLTRPTSLPGVTLSALMDLQPNEIHIAGGYASVSEAIQDQLGELVYP
ncbi:S8 family serine peptidase [Ornithinimicrobium panacihumi]|uniref:S8 family serine peptidase n=1 Tax=Ornithinimicrobium panacihumi TaxID=2008449 RepID=UPI003F8C3901